MGLGRFLNHRVSIIRQSVTLDDGDPVLDDYGHPVTTDSTLAFDVPAGIQPKREQEIAALHQAGLPYSDHTIYLFPRDVRTSDAILHDPASCPVPNDLPTGRYQIVGVPDAAGGGHHVEIRAKLVNVVGAYATPVGGS